MTSTMSTWRSNQLSYNPISLLDVQSPRNENYINICLLKMQYLFRKKFLFYEILYPCVSQGLPHGLVVGYNEERYKWELKRSQ